MKRYGVNWLRVWLGNVGCLVPFAVAVMDLTGFTPYPFFLFQLLLQSVAGVYGKYKTTRSDRLNLGSEATLTKMIEQRRRSLADHEKQFLVATVVRNYTAVVLLALIAVAVARYQHQLTDVNFVKAVVYAFGVPVVAIGGARVAAREQENSDVNRALDQQIARENSIKQQARSTEPQSLSAATPATKISGEKSLQATKTLL